jgi:hypothetical protein
VPQSVGKDFSAADKGRKFAAGGVMKQKINKQDTKHGMMDMPFSSLKKYTGFKNGGTMKRYAEGGATDEQMNQSFRDSKGFKEAFRDARGEGVSTFTWRGKKYSTALAPAKDVSAKSAPQSMKSIPSGETDLGAVSGRTSPMRDKSLAIRALEEERNIGRENERRMDEEKRNPDVERILGTRIGRTFKKGGSVKESKAMVKKEVEFFKKKGAPASMIKHEKAEMKGMKRGGMTMRPKKDIMSDQMAMAPYARGGGIESKGKTKGTMIKMASGGFVRSADGIATKGKTKGRMC